MRSHRWAEEVKVLGQGLARWLARWLGVLGAATARRLDDSGRQGSGRQVGRCSRQVCGQVGRQGRHSGAFDGY